MKRYFVLMCGKRFQHTFTTNSLKLARWMADLRIWEYAKIHDAKMDDVDPPWSKCIYIKKRES